MSSRNFYTNNASTPIRSGALLLPFASASTIASTSWQKNYRADNKYSNTSSERSRDSKNDAGTRRHTGSRTSDDVETRKRKTKRDEREKIVKRRFEAWSGDGRSWETTKECDDPLISTEKMRSSDQLQKISENDVHQKDRESESIPCPKCQESPGAMYSWERPIEVVRDHPKVVDDLESIFDKPLPRLPDPRSQKKNDIRSDDSQLIDLDEDFAWNNLAVGPIRTYPGPTESGDGSNRVEKQIHRTRHIRYKQLMLEMRRKSEEKTREFDRSKRKKRRRRSPPCQMVTIRGRVGARDKPRIYDNVSSMEESSDDQIRVFKWDGRREKFIRRPLSPAKSFSWGISAYYNKQNELFDEMYREYEESLPRRKNKKIIEADTFRDYRAEQTLIRSRRKINQAKILAGRNNNVKSSRSQKNSRNFDDVPKSLSSLSIRTSLVGKRRVNDDDSILIDCTPNANYIQSYAADLGTRENEDSTSEASAKNWQSTSQKKSLTIVENPGRKYAVQSKCLIDRTLDSFDDDSPTQTSKRRRRRRRANNFDLTALQFFASDFAKKSLSNYEHGDFFSENPNQEGRDECSAGYRLEYVPIIKTRSQAINEIAKETSKKQRIEKSIDIFSKFEGKTSSSSDESTSIASKDTLIVDHSFSQSIERIPNTMVQKSNRNAGCKYRKKIRKLSSSSDSSNGRNPSGEKATIRSMITLPEWSVKKCSLGRWKIYNLGNFNDGQKNWNLTKQSRIIK